MTFSSPSKSYSDSSPLAKSLETLGGFEQQDIPFWIWLLENPQSLISLPGSISLFNHDCLHILLDCGLSLEDEAFVIGFTMGNDPRTNPFHIAIYYFFASFIFPADYRFNAEQFKHFFAGYKMAREIDFSCIHKVDFGAYRDSTIGDLRSKFGIDIQKVREIRNSLDDGKPSNSALVKTPSKPMLPI